MAIPWFTSTYQQGKDKTKQNNCHVLMFQMIWWKRFCSNTLETSKKDIWRWYLKVGSCFEMKHISSVMCLSSPSVQKNTVFFPLFLRSVLWLYTLSVSLWLGCSWSWNCQMCGINEWRAPRKLLSQNSKLIRLILFDQLIIVIVLLCQLHQVLSETLNVPNTEWRWVITSLEGMRD